MAAIEDNDTAHPRRRWGTVMLLTLFTFVALSMVVLIVLSVIVPPAMTAVVETYTDTEPGQLPEVTFTEIEKDELDTRLEAFEDALNGDEDVQPFQLNEREINGLLAKDDTPPLAYLTIENGTLKAQMSLPVETDLEIGPWRHSMQGRYINGIAEIRLAIKDDFLTADLVSFTVKGEPVPTWLRSILQREIHNQDWLRSQDVRDVVGKLDRIEFDKGQLVLHPK